MNAHDATAGDKLTAVSAVCSQAVNHPDKTQAAVLAVHERAVTGNVNISRNEHSKSKQNGCNQQRPATAMQRKKQIKQGQDNEHECNGEPKE